MEQKVWLNSGDLHTGLGFSRPKPVLAIQIGINCDEPVFFSYFFIQNWEKLSKTGENYISSR